MESGYFLVKQYPECQIVDFSNPNSSEEVYLGYDKSGAGDLQNESGYAALKGLFSSREVSDLASGRPRDR